MILAGIIFWKMDVRNSLYTLEKNYYGIPEIQINGYTVNTYVLVMLSFSFFDLSFNFTSNPRCIFYILEIVKTQKT